MNDTHTSDKNVVSTVRNAVVTAATEAALLKQKTEDMVGKGWNDSRPQREKAVEQAKKVGTSVVDFANDVTQGVKEGIAEVQKKSKDK